MKRHVLVVEDEPTLLRGLLRALEREPTLRATGCSRVEEAERVIEEDPPDLLVTDINLPQRSGLELVHLVETRGLGIPILVVTAYRAAFDASIPAFGNLTIVEKPLPIKELRRIILERLGREDEHVQNTLGASDYLLLTEMSRQTAAMSFDFEDGSTATVKVVKGEIWTATFESCQGAAAIREMVARSVAEVRIKPLVKQPSERTLHVGTEELLLDLFRQRDEDAQQ